MSTGTEHSKPTSETTHRADDSTMPVGGRNELSRQDAIKAVERARVFLTAHPLHEGYLRKAMHELEKTLGYLEAKPENKP